MPNLNLETYREFNKRGIPVIFYNGHRSDLNFSYVIADDHQGGYLAAKHLLDYGHRKICAMFKLDEMQGHGRFHGFARAFRDYGLPIPEDHILWFSTEDYMGIWNETNSKLDDLILEQINNCTAMVAYNDYVTVRIIKLLKKHGIQFPDDFSLVSFDDTDLTSFSGITITSIEHPSLTMGDKLGALVMELINNPTKVSQIIIPTNIIIRQSTKPFLK